MHLYNTVELADIAYTAYCEAVGNKAFNGDELPDWKTFSSDPTKLKQANAWLHAINSVLGHMEKH